MDFTDNPVNHFPTYEPSEERIAAIQAELEEENNPLNLHYDASQEVRAKGAGFYQFSGDEEARKKQMEELKKARVETEKTRVEVGAVDLRPGEVEGMQAEDGTESTAGTSTRSRAMEKRKRELEERRKTLEAKRRKKDPASGSASIGTSQSIVHQSLAPSEVISRPPDVDPLGVLEAETKMTQRNPQPTPKPRDVADEFLASLEFEIIHGKRGS
jgi:hypothetical protein